MSDCTPITKNLRMYLYEAMVEIPSCLKRAFSFCDNIDAKYKSLEGGCADLRGFADRVREAAESHEDITVFGVDYMALPLDADGEAIHIGDMMHGTCLSGKYVCGEVSAIGDNKFWLCNVQFSLCPSFMHHYHKPTAADVLREFVTEFNRDDSELCDDEIIERFAKRLQLAEVDE